MGSVPLSRDRVPSTNILYPVSSLIFVSFTRGRVSLCERNFFGGINVPDTEIYSKGATLVFVGGGGLFTRESHYHKWVSHSQNGKEINGGLNPSSVRDAAFTGSDLSKIEHFCASVKDAVIVEDQVSAEGTVNVDKGGLSADPQGGPSTDPVRSVGHIRGDPKKGSSWASIVDVKSDVDDFASKTNLADTADADGVTPVAADGVNDAGRPKFVSYLAEKSRNVVFAGSRVLKKGPSRGWVTKKPMTSSGCAEKLVTGPESRSLGPIECDSGYRIFGTFSTGPEFRSLVPIEGDTGCRITGTLNTEPETRSPVMIDGNNGCRILGCHEVVGDHGRVKASARKKNGVQTTPKYGSSGVYTNCGDDQMFSSASPGEQRLGLNRLVFPGDFLPECFSPIRRRSQSGCDRFQKIRSHIVQRSGLFSPVILIWVCQLQWVGYLNRFLSMVEIWTI